jgi:two-component system nitrate/nitrite response regulator NarL
MPPISPASLVYTQEDEFLVTVGEPLRPEEIRRVVVAKADALYADALRAASARAFPEAVVEICRTGETALRALRERAADFVLLGLTFNDLDGIDVLQAINRELLARRVVVVSGRRDERSLQLLRVARFDGLFDPVEERPEQFLAALQQIAAGQGYLSSSLCRHMIERRQAGVLVLQLSPAELQVFCMIGDGTDDAEAAERLGLREATVQTHRRNIMRKLEITTRGKLVREAVRLGVIRIVSDGRVLRPGFASPGARAEERLRTT